MYTNELLEEKYKAQRELANQAEKEGKDYMELVMEEVQKNFIDRGWSLNFSKRKGGFIEKPGTSEYSNAYHVTKTK